MAEKRMISRRITESDKIRALANAGKYRACFYYTAFLAYLDKSGRMNANPMLLKGSLFEGYEDTVEDIDAALHDLARVGLIRLYSNGRHSHLMQYEKFTIEAGGFNKPHPKEPESQLPSPDDAGSSVLDALTNDPESTGKVPGRGLGLVRVGVGVREEPFKRRDAPTADKTNPPEDEPEPFDPLLLAGHLSKHIARQRLHKLGQEWQREVMRVHTEDSIAVASRYVEETPNAQPDLLEKILDGRVRPPAAPLAAIAHDIRQERADEHARPA